MKSRAPIYLILCLLALHSNCFGRFYMAFDSVKDSGIKATLASSFDKSSSKGYNQVTLEITNGTKKEHSWTLVAEPAGGYYNGSVTSIWEVSVPAGQKRSFDLLVPPEPMPMRHYYGSSFTIHGYGCYGSISISSAFSSSSYGSGTAYIYAMSPDVYDVAFTALENRYGGGSSSVAGIELASSSEHLPTSWLGWTMFSTVLMDGDYWRNIPSPQKVALREWVMSGGEVRIIGKTQEAELDVASQLGLGQIRYYSEGTLESESKRIANTKSSFFDILDSETVGAALMTRLGEAGHTVSGFDFDPLHTAWYDIKTVSGDIWFIALLLVIYVIVIGPLNLFVLAPRHRRQRLFITIPLIAFATTFLLVAIILFSDGTGGRGQYTRATFYAPEANRSITWGDYTSKTALLLDKEFEVDEATFITYRAPLERGRAPDALNFHQDKQLSGDWFRSRFVQCQTLGAVTPSREDIQLIDFEGSKPVLQSGINARISELYYLDEHGNFWKVENLRTGERKTMQLSSESDYGKFWTSFSNEAGLSMSAFAKVANREGWFVAIGNKTDAGDTQMIDSIKWTGNDYFFGPIIKVQSKGGEHE